MNDDNQKSLYTSDICPGIWYKFDTHEARISWLKQVYPHIVIQKGSTPSIDAILFRRFVEKYSTPDLLSVVLVEVRHWRISFRTSEQATKDFNPGAVIKIYVEDVTNIQPSYSYPPYSETFDKKEDTNVKLIENRKNLEKAELHSKYVQSVENFLRTTKMGVAILAVNPDIQSLNFIQFNDLVTEEELKTLQELKDQFNVNTNLLYDRYFELNELFNITENYEQRVALLKKYNILLDSIVSE